MTFQPTILALALALAAFLCAGFPAQEGASPFHGTLKALPRTQTEDALLLEARIQGPPGGKLSPGWEIVVDPPGDYAWEVLEAPEADEEEFLPANATLRLRLSPRPPEDATVSFVFQGCVETLCHRPQAIFLDDRIPSDTAESATSPGVFPEGWRLSAPLGGYAGKDAFLEWLEAARTTGGQAGAHEDLLAKGFRLHGWVWACLLVMGMGVLLNLTPCVLPMIPVTLGVLGARGGGGGRGRGAALGAVYGGAMALAYGVSGALVVALGGQFGALHAKPLFQFLLAALFLILGLSLFDLFSLDFTRFRRGLPADARRGSYGTAFLLGATAALLAGACVAPVLLWVLALSTALYQGGHPGALWLPLLLGVGLGAPWPLLGAGIGALPRPGAWMNRLKSLMGVVILLFALRSAATGIRLMKAPVAIQEGPWMAQLDTAAALSRDTKKPLLLYFRGEACAACDKMERGTLRDPAVLPALEEFVCVSIWGDRTENRALADACHILGFPTFLVARPEDGGR